MIGFVLFFLSQILQTVVSKKCFYRQSIHLAQLSAFLLLGKNEGRRHDDKQTELD
jgi:hypothetical protein